MCYSVTMNNKMITSTQATPEQLQARLELRRSNASGGHKNKKTYTRKLKHKKGW